MTNFDKYIDSTSVHYISNSGSDERGKTHGGEPGDQTGGEWRLRSWYARPWTVVLRYPDPAVGLKIAELSIAAALNNRIGYDQYKRYTYWDQLQKAGYDPSKITVACCEDCTSGVTANVKAVGHLMGIKALQNIDIDTYSANMRARFVRAGFEALTASRYVSGYAYLQPGDVLLYEGRHAATNITRGAKAATVSGLVNGSHGAAVKAMQEGLLALGYDLGKWGADGDFGDCTEIALKEFQVDHGLKVDGVFGEASAQAMRRALEAGNSAPTNGRHVTIRGGQCYVRSAPTTLGAILGVAKDGSVWDYGGETSESGWLLIDYKNGNGWVSGKYAKLVD